MCVAGIIKIKPPKYIENKKAVLTGISHLVHTFNKNSFDILPCQVVLAFLFW